MLSVGCSGAMNFVVSHELLHSPAKGDKRVASLALMPVAYSHWVASHLAHHRKVRLPQAASPTQTPDLSRSEGSPPQVDSMHMNVREPVSWRGCQALVIS